MKLSFTKRREGWYQVDFHARQLGFVRRTLNDGWEASFPVTSLIRGYQAQFCTRREAAAYLKERRLSK